MNRNSGRAGRVSGAWSLALTLVSATTGAAVAPVVAQQAGRARPLVFTGVTVVDVTDGTLHPEQTVVITGPRITALGPARTVPMPRGARGVDARGKYLIPGLWDMHAHVGVASGASARWPLYQAAAYTYRQLLAAGVTGIRDAGTAIPLDTLVRWRREILAGRRIGPPRQFLAGGHLEGRLRIEQHQVRVCSVADVRRAADSLRAAGADHIKLHQLGVCDSTRLTDRPMDVAFRRAAVAEVRRLGLVFGGHLDLTDSDSGARFLDHFLTDYPAPECLGDSATVERCQQLATRLRHNDTWAVPAIIGNGPAVARAWQRLSVRHQEALRKKRGFLLPEVTGTMCSNASPLDVVEQTDMPMLLGPDLTYMLPYLWLVGAAVQDAFPDMICRGLTPLRALQVLTLEPARALHATDSLGTVAVGKLADLVLLDKNPLAGRDSKLVIHAVVANGRYYDRAALDAVAGDETALDAMVPELQ